MSEQTKWVFPTAERYEKKGLNDSGVETFRGDTISSLAREICQNSLDAAVKVQDGSVPLPVEVVFSLFELPTDKFPGIEEFHSIIDSAAEYWQNNEQATAFFKTAKSALDKPTMPCLRISDTYTMGLTGVNNVDADIDSAWSSLVMSSGVSAKGGEYGGSFGIGKFAAFSCSELRTVFYATRTSTGEQGFQGVSRLLSFKHEDGYALGTGYYGNSGIKPIGEWRSLDSDFLRDKPGTDIFIPALVENENFRNDIVTSVLRGFLYAIFKKRLVVIVENDEAERLTIDAKWLENAVKKNDPRMAEFTKQYQAIKRPESLWKEKEIAGGKVRLSLISEKDLDKRIAMIRQPGMLIFPKGNFQSHVSFTGVLVVEGALNSELKHFENPQHNKWEEKRCSEKKAILNAVYEFCREAVREIVKENLGESIDSGLGDVLPDAGEEDEKRMEEVLDVKVKTANMTIHKPKKNKRKGTKVEKGGEKSEHEGGGKHTSSGEAKEPSVLIPTKGKNEGGENGSHNVQRYDFEPKSFRPICRDKERGAYTVKIMPSKDIENASIELFAVAEIKQYSAPVREAYLSDGTILKVENGEIKGLKLRKNVTSEINVMLDYSDYASLEVVCHEYK